MSNWQLTNVDHALLEQTIRPLLPDRIFDAHAHLYRADHFAPENRPDFLTGSAPVVDVDQYINYVNLIHPGASTTGALCFGLAFTGDRDANNHQVATACAQARAQGLDALGQMVIAPEMDPDWVQEQVRASRFVGLKPYHTMARVDGPTWHAPIHAYLPEAHVQVAHAEKLTITLHMVRDRALADPVNQATIRRYCESYPDMRLILAHAARGFNPWHTIEGIESLRGLPNVWFDTSAVTEAGAFEAIVETMGVERLLYGTDFPVSHQRGRCVALGDSFYWIYADELAQTAKHTQLEPALIGVESLRALVLACRRLRLTDGQIEQIFHDNARTLFGLTA